jgi:DNA-binding XRE family transcriptional regulator
VADVPTEWDRFTSAAVLDLIGPVANDEGAPDLSLVGPTIRAARIASGASQKGFAGRIGVVPATLSEISNHEVRPSLETVLRICAVGGWSPAALFQGKLRETFAPLADIPAPEGRRPIDWSEVDRELGTAIRRGGEPEASATIAQRLGIDIGLLRDKRPDQVAALVEKRRSWIARGKAARLDDAIATVEAITRQIILTGGTASRREVETYLPAPLQLRERPLQEAWRRARAS